MLRILVLSNKYKSLGLMFLFLILASSLVACFDPSEPSPQNHNYATGLEIISPEIFDSYPAAIPPSGASLQKESYDLSSNFPTPGFQGDKHNSCSAWAAAYLKTYQEAIERGWSAKQHAFSPAYIYNQLIQGNHPKSEKCEQKTSIYAALELLKNDGDVFLDNLPYVAGSCDALPGPSLKAKALEYRIRSFDPVEHSIKNGKSIFSISHVKDYIASDIPVVIGFQTTLDFKNLSSNIYTDTNVDSSDKEAQHAMVVVAYDDKKRAFKVINSWGVNWGVNGFGWISYEAFKARTLIAYVVTDKTTKVNHKPQFTSLHVDKTAGTAPLTVTYNWQVSDIDGDNLTCIIDVDDNGTNDYTIANCQANNSKTHTFTAPGKYHSIIRVDDSRGGIVSKYASEITVSKQVIKPTINSFTADSKTLKTGESTNLRWDVTGTAPIMLSINPDIGIVTGNQHSVSPKVTTTYRLTATNSAGSAQKAVTIKLTAQPQPKNSKLVLKQNNLSISGQLGQTPPPLKLSLENSGQAASNYYVESKSDFLSVSPDAGNIAAQASQEITITAANCTTAGTTNGTIVFKDADSTATLNVKRICATTTGSLSVTVTPNTATVTVTGPSSYSKSFVGGKTISNLKPGTYTLSAHQGGYVDTSATVAVGANKTTKATLTLSKSNSINIPDINLAKRIRTILDIPSTRAIKLSDMLKLTFFNSGHNNYTPESEKIRNLEGLQYAANLKTLILSYNRVADVKKLSGLKQLTHLWLDHNQLDDADLTTIAKLGTITSLRLNGNQLSNIAALANLKNLIWLKLSDNAITDISPLANMNHLDWLALSNNKIKNIAPLLSTGLEGANNELYLEGNCLVVSEGSSSLDHIRTLKGRGVLVKYLPQSSCD